MNDTQKKYLLAVGQLLLTEKRQRFTNTDIQIVAGIPHRQSAHNANLALRMQGLIDANYWLTPAGLRLYYDLTGQERDELLMTIVTHMARYFAA